VDRRRHVVDLARARACALASPVRLCRLELVDDDYDDYDYDETDFLGGGDKNEAMEPVWWIDLSFTPLVIYRICIGVMRFRQSIVRLVGTTNNNNLASKSRFVMYPAVCSTVLSRQRKGGMQHRRQLPMALCVMD
jgi:hypothetical protein